MRVAMTRCAIAGALSAALAVGVSTRQVGAAPAADFIPEGLLTAEMANLQSARAGFDAFDRDAKMLEARPTRTRADVERLQAQADALKGQMPAVQRSLNGAISKLQAAGKWTADFDKLAADRLRAAGRSDLLQTVAAAGGARAYIQRAAADASRVAAELDSNLNELRPKPVAARWLEAVVGVKVSASLITDIRKAISDAVVLLRCCLKNCA